MTRNHKTMTDKKIWPNFFIVGEPKGKLSGRMLSSVLVYKIGIKLIPQNLMWSLRDKLLLGNKEKPKLSEEDVKILQKFYKEDVEDLEKLLGRKLPWKWFS